LPKKQKKKKKGEKPQKKKLLIITGRRACRYTIKEFKKKIVKQ